MPPRPPVVTLQPLGQRFKAEIEKATADGAAPSELVLQLTRADASKMKRDPAIPMEDINFADGEMRYLGVRVAEGTVKTSALVNEAAEAVG